MDGNREPVAVINVLVAFVEATVILAVTFGFPLTNEQVGAISAVLISLGNIVATLWSRSQVTPIFDPKTNDGSSLVVVNTSTTQD